jgi:hypothetical protein
VRRSQPNIETEAGALQKVYRLAEGLPPGQRAVLQRQAQACAVAAVECDWPETAAGQPPASIRQIDWDADDRGPRPAVSRFDPRR